MANEGNGQQIGHIVPLIGPVVDVEFPKVIYPVLFTRRFASPSKVLMSRLRLMLSPRSHSIWARAACAPISRLPHRRYDPRNESD